MRRSSRRPSWWSELPEPDDRGPRPPVELKVLLTEESRQAVRDAACGALPSRSLHWFDTPDLDLARHGIVVRVRAVGEHRGDVTVKIRRSGPVRVPKPLRGHRDLAVEIDTLPDMRHWSAGLRRELGPETTAELLAGRRSLDDVLSRAQHRLYGAPARDVPALDRLRPVGPVLVRRMKLATLRCGSRVVAETCRYPDGSRLVEISVKCPAARAVLVAEEVTALLRDLHVDTASTQRTKTGTALAMLARTAS